MNLAIDLSKVRIKEAEIDALAPRAEEACLALCSGNTEFTGWVRLPQEYDHEELATVLAAAEEIKKKCSLLIVIGIGGSYLGARAVIEALQSQTILDGNCPDKAENRGVRILFAGNNISGIYHMEILHALMREETCLCVISKSGMTTEPLIAFTVLKDALIRKYGEKEAKKRIYAITDRQKGVLREEADREGYTVFAVPEDIGGRYSVLTPVGLLPIAAAGIDVKELLAGAKEAGAAFWVSEEAGHRKEFCGGDEKTAAYRYAAARYLLEKKGKTVEIFEYYEPRLAYFAEWLKQLFGESEGKEGKGLFPASLSFSADLHSMGQFLQEGRQIFFETILYVKKPGCDIIIPESAGIPLAGKSMNQVNEAAMIGVIAAHEKVGIPMIKIEIPELTPYYFGQMIYFFEMTCAVTGGLMGINPFNQPGVESYKAEMQKELQRQTVALGGAEV